MSKHLFIGIGGQGGKTLCELRRIIALKETEFNESGAKVDYLYVDSSPDVWQHRTAWTVLGKDVRLPNNSWLPLREGNVGSFTDISMDANVAPWIGNPATMRSYVGAEWGATPGANQRRRFGRLLFTQHAGRFINQVRSQVDHLVNDDEHECTFHVLATLAGGTGSGAIVDIIALLRSTYPNASDFKIYGYVYVTDNDGGKADVGYFYPNQYAALRDLNALMAGPYRPHDITATQNGDRYKGATFINGLFITSNLTAANRKISIERQIKTVADWCYQRTYALSTGQLSPNALRALTVEDVIEAYPGEPLPTIERSYRFGALGIRRWAIPEDELQDKMLIEHACSALRQMLFNNWVDGEGFDGTSKTTSVEERAALAEQCCRNAALSREEIVLDKAEDNPDIASCWTQHLNSLHARFAKRLSGGEEEGALELFEHEVDNVWASGFRQQGVLNYFNRMATQTTERAKTIRHRLGEELNRAWLQGSLGLNDVLAIIEKIRQNLDNIRSELQQSGLNDRDKDLLQRRMAARRLEWGKLTLLSSFFRRTDLLRAHREDLKRLYVGRTRDKATEYGRNLIGAFLAELSKIEARCQKLRDDLTDLLKRKEDRSVELCKPGAADMQADSVIRELDIPALQAVLEYTRRNRNHQQGLAEQVRGALLAGGNRIDTPLASDEVEHTISEVSGERMRSGHTDATQTGLNPVLGRSILDRLQEKYQNSPPELRRVMTEFMSGSVTNLKRGNPQQPRLELNDRHAPFMPKRLILVFLPERGRHPFSAAVEQAIQEARPAGESVVFEVVENRSRSELVIFVTDYWMALRFSVVGEELQKKYLAGGNPQMRYFCNLDADGENGRIPDYMPVDTEELKKQSEAAYWLAKELGIVEVNSAGRLHLHIMDSKGFSKAELLAESEDSRTSLDIHKRQQLVSVVKGAVASLSPTEKTALSKRVQTQDTEVLKQVNKVLTSPGYQAWTELRGSILQILEAS